MRISFDFWRKWNVPPTPSFTNVKPAGEGWYRYDGKKWQRDAFENPNYDGRARYMDEATLWRFAREALEALAR